MMAFLFTCALFLYWGIAGLAVMTLFPPRLRSSQTLLLSPAVGVAITLLPVFFINRLGLPIKDFAEPLALAILLIAALILAVKRPVFPLRRMAPYAALLAGALLLTGWPLLLYGFDWVSYANDDMANYCLAAQRFLNHGFFDQPDMEVIRAGRDYSLGYWFMHVMGHIRAGSELMLAAVWGATGRNAHQIFMPVIMALNLALISSAGALAGGRKRSLLTMGLLALSPLNTLGALYQLIAQTGGLCFLCAAAVLTYRAQPEGLSLRLLARNVPAILILMAFALWYPEVLPFFGLGWLLYVALTVIFRRNRLPGVIRPAILIGAAILAVLNRYAITMLSFMLMQGTGGMRAASDLSNLIFPYFLVPSGIPALWGLQPIVNHFHEPWLSLTIAAAIACSVWLVWRVLPGQLRRFSPHAILAAIMLTLGVALFYHRSDFALFKLAMYVQPFLCGAIAAGLIPLAAKKSWVRNVSAVAVCLALVIQADYVRRSTGEVKGGLNELPHASAEGSNRQFDALIHSLPPTSDTLLLSTTANVVLAKFQMLYAQGHRLLFPSNDFGNFLIWTHSVRDQNPLSIMQTAQQGGMYEIKTIGDNQFLALRHDLLNAQTPLLISTHAETEIFNHFHLLPGQNQSYFTLQPENSATNLLEFVNSLLGPHYYSHGDKKKVAFYQLETDPMFAGQVFSALGRRLLLRVYHPTPHPRLVLELTDTVVKQFGSQLPPASAQGIAAGFVGRGTGRIFSPPLDLTPIDGVPYLSIDMGRDGQMFPEHKQGLMLLYGRDVPTDRRRLAAFGRDISLISEQEYRALTPPQALQHFPQDLADRNLEYSGIYEDGWISERSFFVLTQKPDDSFLIIKGVVPQIGPEPFHATLHVSIDGRIVAMKSLTAGEFTVKVPAGKMGNHRIDVSADRYEVLPAPDSRPTIGKISFIGYTDG